MSMEVDGRQLPVKIDETNTKHQQPLVALNGNVNNFQTVINQTHD